MSLYPNDKPFEKVEDLISSLFLRDGCDPATVAWACQTRQHHVLEEIIRIQLSRPYIPADLNVSSDTRTARILGLGRGYSNVDSAYLLPMRALSSGDPLIMDLCYIIRSNPNLSSIYEFDQLLEQSPVRQVYRSLLLADIGLPLKSINQYCLITWLKRILDDPNEDLSTWFIPKQREMTAYTTALALQPGQIEMVCDALFTSLLDAAIQQREFSVMLKFLERFIIRNLPNQVIERQFLHDQQPYDIIITPGAAVAPESSSTTQTNTTSTEQSQQQQQQQQPTQPNQMIPLVDALIKLLKLHVVDIVDDQWSDLHDQELLFLAQMREKAIEKKRTELRAQLRGITSSNSNPASQSSSLLQPTDPNRLQPNSMTNIACMYRTMAEMHFFSSFYIYSTRQNHFENLQKTILPMFPQYLWPTSDRCIIKLLSLCLPDEQTSNYIGEIDPKIFEIPQKKSDVLDHEDPEVKFGLMIEDEEFLFQKALDVEARRGLWKLAILYACNLNDHDLIVNLVALSKVTKLDNFMPESIVQVNGTMLSQICNLPHSNASTLHKLLNLYTVKITTNSHTLGIRSNNLVKIATKEHIVIINQHPLLQELLGLCQLFITDYSLFESQSAKKSDKGDKNNNNNLSTSSSSLHDSFSTSQALPTPSSSSSSLHNSQNLSLSSSQAGLIGTGAKPKLNHQLLHQETILQCLYSLLAYVTRLKIYRPAIVYTDIVVLLQVHTAQGVFMPQLYDFLITTVMSDAAIATLFRRSNVISVINSIYSTPKPITHQYKVMTDDYYRYANESGILDNQYNLDEFLVITGHRKKANKSKTLDIEISNDLGSSSASIPSIDELNTLKDNKTAEGSTTQSTTATTTPAAKETKKPATTKKDVADEMKNALKNSFKTITGDLFNTSLPLFNMHFNFVFTRFATVQLFVNSKTLQFEAMNGITTYPSGDVTSPLDNAVLYHDVPTVDYLLSLNFVPLSSTMYHLHQHFVFDHRNATNSGLFSVHGVQPITMGQSNQLAKYKTLFQPSPSQSQQRQAANPLAASNINTSTQLSFSPPHQFFTPTASYHFDLVTYQDFVSSPIGFSQFRQKIFMHLKAQRLHNLQLAQNNNNQNANLSSSSTSTTLSQSAVNLMSSSSGPPLPLTKLTPREIYHYYAFSSPATELMKLLLQANCPIFQLKLLGDGHKRLYQQALTKLADMETERRERSDAGDKSADSAKEQLSMYTILEEQYPGFDSTLVTSRLETLYSIDFHAVQFHQLYHQQQMVELPSPPRSGNNNNNNNGTDDQTDIASYPRSRRDQALSHLPKICQEDIVALLLSAQHNGNPLLIYHIVQTTQLYMSIYTASFITASMTPTMNGGSTKTLSKLAQPLPPYPTIHDTLPSYSYDTLTPEGLTALQKGLSIEEIAKNSSYRKLATTLNAILPLISESPRPLQFTRMWSVLCGKYMYNLQRLPSSLLLILTFIPVTIPTHTFDLVQSYLYGYGDPTSHNPTTGRNVMSLLLSLCGCASDTPALMTSAEHGDSQNETSGDDDEDNLDPSDDETNHNTDNSLDQQQPSLTMSTAAILNTRNTATIKKTNTTTTPRYIFNSEAYALKQNAYEFATGVLGVICGMNNVNKFTLPDDSQQQDHRKKPIPTPFELFHAKPIPVTTSPSSSPTNQQQQLHKTQHQIPTSSPTWPNPYKYHYYYNPSVFNDLLGSTLAMFVISRKTIEDLFCLKILKFLVQNGEDITQANLIGQNSLMLAIAYQRSEDVIKFLLKPHSVTVHSSDTAIPQEDIMFTNTVKSQTTPTTAADNELDGQENHYNGVIPVVKQETKFIDINHVDIFGRNLYHYRLNPGLQYDTTLFTGVLSNTVSQNDKHKCDVMTVGQKQQKLRTQLGQNDDFTMYFPDFDPNSTAPSPSSKQKQQGMRWYDLCDSLMKGMCGVYDGEEVDTRSREFGYIVETFSSAALTELITDTRRDFGPGYAFKLHPI